MKLKSIFPALAIGLLLGPACPQAVYSGPLREALEKKRQQAPGLAEETDLRDNDSEKVTSSALPPGTRKLADVAYGSDPQQKLDVYLPAEPKEAPVIFMVHGGAWMFGDKENAKAVANKASRWLPKGYVLVSTNYRMSKSPDPLQEADDVARALAYTQANCKSWGCDPSRTLLMGHSAGAHLVSLLTAAPEIASRQGASPWLGTVSLDSAMLNVPETMGASHSRLYDRVFKKDRRLWERTSPFHRLKAAPKPTLLVCSLKRKDSCRQARAFAEKAAALGGKATVLPVELGHGPINGELGLPGEYTGSVEAFLRGLGLP